MKEAVFTLKLEPDLREQFVAEASAAHRPASQVMRELMRDYVERQKAAREHDEWIRQEIERGVSQARDPTIRRVSNEDVQAEWKVWRARLLTQAAESKE